MCNSKFNRRAAVLLWASLVAVDIPRLASAATEAPILHLDPGSKLWIEGNSTLHKYRLDARRFSATFTGTTQAKTGESLQSLVRGGDIVQVALDVPVATLSSGEKGLDENMRKAMKATEFPEVKLVFDSYKSSPGASPNTFTLALHGRLTVAGVEHEIQAPAQATVDSNDLHVIGSVPLQMSDYGVKAPILMMGMLKTDDHIVVGFDFHVSGQP